MEDGSGTRKSIQARGGDIKKRKRGNRKGENKKHKQISTEMMRKGGQQGEHQS